MTFAVVESCTACTIQNSAAGHRRFAYPIETWDSRFEAKAHAYGLNASAPNRDGHRYDVAELRDDGWPLCPFCGEDELYSLSQPPRVDEIDGCYRCGTDAGKAADR